MTPPGGPSSGSMCLLSFFVPSFFFFVQVLELWGLFFGLTGALLSAFASSAARDFLVLVPPDGVTRSRCYLSAASLLPPPKKKKKKKKNEL